MNSVKQDAEETDSFLLERCRDRDKDALSVLMRRHAPRAYILAHRMLNDTHEAEDVLQEVFLKIWMRPEKWSPEKGGLFSTWLHKVVVHQCLDFIRKRKDSDDIDGMEITASCRDVATDIDQKERLESLQQAIQRLPARQRSAVVLCYQEGYTQKEAMEMLGIGMKALESLLSRAKATLRQLNNL